MSAEGRWQEFRGCAQPVGQSRPGWKILRVLANQLGLEGFGYESSADVLAEFRGLAGDAAYDGRFVNRARIQGRAPRQFGGASDLRRGPHRPPRRVLAADARCAERRRREGLSHAGIHHGMVGEPRARIAVGDHRHIADPRRPDLDRRRGRDADACRAQGDRLHAAQARPQPRVVLWIAGPARTRPAIRGRHQAAAQGDHRPGPLVAVPVPARAPDRPRAGDRRPGPSFRSRPSSCWRTSMRASCLSSR